MRDVCAACLRTRALAADGRHAANGDRPDLCWALHDGEGNSDCLDMVAEEVVDDEARAAMIRLLVAQQWATAIALLDRVYLGPGFPDGYGVHPDVWACQRLASLPCAHDVVRELMGEV